MKAYIESIEYYLPARKVSNEELSKELGELTCEQIFVKTGIGSRHAASERETAADLGRLAAEKLFQRNQHRPHDIDFLIFCSQSPVHPLPNAACEIHERLGLKNTAGAIDINLGCSGYVYSLSLAASLISTDTCRNILLITGDTYTKYLRHNDRNRTIFGDAGTATILRKCPEEEQYQLSNFIFGTDGSKADHLVYPAKYPLPADSQEILNKQSDIGLVMNGPGILSFTLDKVPTLLQSVLDQSNLDKSLIDFFVLHQANGFVLDQINKKFDIPLNKQVAFFSETGNTVSGTIPLALKHLSDTNRLKKTTNIVLAGFGVGLSWAGCLATTAETL